MKKIVCLSFITCSIFSMQISRINSKKDNLVSKQKIKGCAVFVPERLGHIKLYHDKNRFYVLHNKILHPIQKCFTDPVLRNITQQQLSNFQKVGYIAINQMQEGDFSLKAKIRGSKILSQ